MNLRNLKIGQSLVVKAKVQDYAKLLKNNIEKSLTSAFVTEHNSGAGGYAYKAIFTFNFPVELVPNKKDIGELVVDVNNFLSRKGFEEAYNPSVDIAKKSKNSKLEIKFTYYFSNPFHAYAYGRDLTSFSGFNEIDFPKIKSRLDYAKKTVKELQNKREEAIKALEKDHPTASKEESNKLWKENYGKEWLKLNEIAKGKGLAGYKFRN